MQGHRYRRHCVPTAVPARTANGGRGSCLTDDGSPGGVPGVDSGEGGAGAPRRRAPDPRSHQAMPATRRSAGAGGRAPSSRRRWTTWPPSVTRCARRCATARSAATTAPTGGRIAGRRPTASSSCRPFTSRGPGPGFLIDTSSSMQDTQLARAVAELGGLTRQLGYSTEVVVACCDAVVHDVKKVFTAAQVEMYGGGGTDIGAGLRWFTSERAADRSPGRSSAIARRRGRRRRRRFR